MTNTAKAAWQKSGEQELVAVISSAARQAAGSMPESTTPPQNALLRFSAPGADITLFAANAENDAQAMAKETGGSVHRGQASGPLSDQIAQYRGSQQSESGSSSSRPGSQSSSTPNA